MAKIIVAEGRNEFIKYRIVVDWDDVTESAGDCWEAIDKFGETCEKQRQETRENPANPTKLIELFIYRPYLNDWYRAAGEHL